MSDKLLKKLCLSKHEGFFPLKLIKQRKYSLTLREPSSFASCHCALPDFWNSRFHAQHLICICRLEMQTSPKPNPRKSSHGGTVEGKGTAHKPRAAAKGKLSAQIHVQLSIHQVCLVSSYQNFFISKSFKKLLL